MLKYLKDDYLDAEVSYLIGLIVARGTLTDQAGDRRITIEIPTSALEGKGIKLIFDQDVYSRLALSDLRDRLNELLDTDISISRKPNGADLVIRFRRNVLAWRDIILILNHQTSFPYFQVPEIFFQPDIPIDWKRAFMTGYADVAGNIRTSNVYVDGRHRVRLDVLNYPTNWKIPVQLCTLLQEHLNIAVQNITWGHPNLGRGFREHQINIFADDFLPIGFTFEYKSQILTELGALNKQHKPTSEAKPCPGMRQIRKVKEASTDEHNAEKLASELVGFHADSYWQICKKLGCKRIPLGTPSEALDEDIL
jgi:hypothetical protein